MVTNQGIDKMSSKIVRGRVPENLRNEFLAYAAQQGLTESAAVQHLIKGYVSHMRLIHQRKQETLEALADVEAGLVVSGEAVMDWVSSWGTPDEKDPPLK